jgi:type II secretory pathway pseudopilin PulG
MMRFVKKSFFTLMEIMVVMFILSLVMAVTGIKLKGAYDEQRFLSESQEVLSTLALAQDLMLIMDADVQFILAYNDQTKHLEAWLDVEKPLYVKRPLDADQTFNSDKPLNDSWRKMIERKIQLPAIQSFTFDENSTDPLKLTFTLGKMSKGKLILSSQKESSKKESALTFEIDLPGYPSPLIKRFKENKKENDRDDRHNDPLYPQEIYDKIYK